MTLYAPDSSGNTFTSTRRFFLLFSALLGSVQPGSGLSQPLPTTLNLFGSNLILVHDGPADGVGAVVGKLADEVNRDDALAAGVGVAFDDDVGIAETCPPACRFPRAFRECCCRSPD